MTRPELKPGDLLLYHTKGWIGLGIRIKTWSPVNHVETYLGDNKTAASRDGVGVDTFDLYKDGEGGRTLKFVLRPVNIPDFKAGRVWHDSVIGQGYDLLGLFINFFSAYHGGHLKKMFCSEHATRFARAAGYEPFTALVDADKVSPGMFLASPAYEVVYRQFPA